MDNATPITNYKTSNSRNKVPFIQKSAFGAEINALKNEVQQWLKDLTEKEQVKSDIDVTAPFALNTKQKPY